MRKIMNNTLLAAFLFATVFAVPAMAQDQLMPIPSGKVIDTKEERVNNADGSVTIIRKTVTETENPNLPRPAGVPAHAKARNITTYTTTVTQPADGPAIFYDGITEPLDLRGKPSVAPGVDVQRTITERQTLTITKPDGKEDVQVNEVQQTY